MINLLFPFRKLLLLVPLGILRAMQKLISLIEVIKEKRKNLSLRKESRKDGKQIIVSPQCQ